MPDQSPLLPVEFRRTTSGRFDRWLAYLIILPILAILGGISGAGLLGLACYYFAGLSEDAASWAGLVATPLLIALVGYLYIREVRTFAGEVIRIDTDHVELAMKSSQRKIPVEQVMAVYFMDDREHERERLVVETADGKRLVWRGNHWPVRGIFEVLNLTAVPRIAQQIRQDLDNYRQRCFGTPLRYCARILAATSFLAAAFVCSAVAFLKTILEDGVLDWPWLCFALSFAVATLVSWQWLRHAAAGVILSSSGIRRQKQAPAQELAWPEIGRVTQAPSGLHIHGSGSMAPILVHRALYNFGAVLELIRHYAPGAEWSIKRVEVGGEPQGLAKGVTAKLLRWWWSRRDHTREWRADPNLELVLDLDSRSLCGVSVGDPVERLSRLGPVEGSTQVQYGAYVYFSRGCEFRAEARRIVGFGVMWEQAIGYIPFSGACVHGGESVHLSNQSTVGEIIERLGEPPGRTSDEDGSIELRYLGGRNAVDQSGVLFKFNSEGRLSTMCTL